MTTELERLRYAIRQIWEVAVDEPEGALDTIELLAANALAPKNPTLATTEAELTTAQAEIEALRARVAELLEFIAAREAVEAAIRVYGGARYPEDVRDAYRDLCNAQERLKNASAALSGSKP